MPIRWPKGKRPCFVGVGQSPCVRIDITPNFVPRSLSDISHEAATKAIADAGLTAKDIDGISVFPMSAAHGAAVEQPGVDMVGAAHMMQVLGLENVRWYAELIGPMAVTSIIEAANALASGSCNYVLVWRSLHHPVGVTYRRIRSTTAGQEAQFRLPYGYDSYQALHHTRYMEKYGATREEMGAWIVHSNRNAQINENSVWRGKTITLEQYMKARFISYPMCLYDYDMPVDVCACVIITTEDRAKDTPHPGGYIAGYGLSPYNKLKGGVVPPLEELYEMNSLLARNMYESAGMGPKDVDVAQIYDGFSPMVWTWLEVFGFCGVGEAHLWTQGGRVAIDGEMPINTFGGSLGEGRIHGMGHITETARQMMGTAGPSQVKGAEVALCQVGTFLGGASFICTRE